MAGNVSPKDLQTIQDGLVDQLITPDNLPENVRSQVFQYMGQQGINMQDPSSQVTQAQLAQLKAQRQAQSGGIFDSKIFKPIEWVGSKLYQLYSATVSPAASFAGLELGNAVRSFEGGPQYMKDEGLSFGQEWDLAHHVSPGQAWWMTGMNENELKKSGIDQKTLYDQAKQIEAGTFQHAPTKDDPFGVQTNLERYFSNGPAKYVTGALDFGLSWYADPLVLAGKGLSATKLATFTRPVARGIEGETKAVMKTAPEGFSAADANEMAWNNFTAKQPFQSLTDRFWDIKSANPDIAEAKMLQEPTLAKSANGPAVARLLGQATDKTQVANVLRVTMGDNAANEALKLQNGEIAYQIDQLNQRVSLVGAYYSALSDAQKITPFGLRVKALMDNQTKQIAALDRDTQMISDRIKAFGTIGDMNYNRFTTPAGAKVRDAWQASRDWRPFQDGGFIKSQVNNIYSLSLGGVVKLAHAYGDIKPSAYIDVKSDDGWRQLDANLAEVKGITPEARQMYVSQYLSAPETMRPAALQNIEQTVTRRMVDRYNDSKGLIGTDNEVSHEIADGLYREVAARRGAAQGTMRSEQFGTAQIENPDLPGTQIRVDEIAPDGGKVVVAPLLRTQMANSHVMMDFGLFEKALNANASTWQKALLQSGNQWQKVVNVADYVNHIWKFSALFRLGYGPRALSDDALGQLARFGPVDMMARSLAGGKYTWQTLRRAMMPNGQLEAALVSRSHLGAEIDDLTSAQKELQDQIASLRSSKVAGAKGNLRVAQSQLESNMDTLAERREAYANMDSLVKGGAAMKHTQVGRQLFAPAYAGAEGGLFRDLASGEKNFENMMGSSADTNLNQLRRMDWTQISPAKHGADVHMNAWLDVLNKQVAHDALASQYLKGKSPRQLTNWLSSPDGLAYKSGHRIAQHLPNDQLVDRVTAQVDEWANRAFPGGDAIRQAASNGEVTKDMLQQVPEIARPLVNGQALSYARGSHQAMQIMDKFMSGFYKIMGEMPAKYLLRNPLFARQYNVHLNDLMTTIGKQGETRMTEDLRQQLQSAARKRALQDVKQNTFTMDHETKLSYMMKNFGAFFGAQQESWNRWGRIISDKPDILGRIAQVMGAPTRVGLSTDANGQRIDADGYVTDPITGQRRLTSYNERHIVLQIPDYLGGAAFKKFFGLDKNATFDIPLSTANIILNHGDGPIPVSAGPYVQIAANHIVKDSPTLADLSTNLGILPFGVSDSDLQAFLPNWARKAQGADSMSETYQQNLFYIMQAEHYKYMEGLRKTAPTWKEISDRADKQSLMKVLFAAALPISLSAKDPYDFFRQQYKAMQSVDPQGADQRFYDKFGDSAYMFSKSLSKNNSGLQPTANAVKMSKYYQDLIAKTGPEWAGLIVGAEGEGTYSQGAFHYEQTHATDPSSGGTMRSKMSARDAMAEANKALGWRQYNAEMNRIYAELYQAGFQSFNDPGAENLRAEKQALVTTLGSPQIMDASGQLVDNPHYNKDWSAAYNSLDTNYYDRQTVALKQIVNDPEIWSKAVNPDRSVGMRSDIYSLKTYLNYRDDAMRALLLRESQGGSKDINAQSNEDIKGQWDSMVLQLVQSDTKFGDLFNRYLSRDMGYDKTTVQEQSTTGQLPTFQGDISQPADTSIFDILAQEGAVGTGGAFSGATLSTPQGFVPTHISGSSTRKR